MELEKEHSEMRRELQVPLNSRGSQICASDSSLDSSPSLRIRNPWEMSNTVISSSSSSGGLEAPQQHLKNSHSTASSKHLQINGQLRNILCTTSSSTDLWPPSTET
ncbi:hypothetical protein Droror1_Dr00006910 [Drosera rotundifolia]